MQLIVARPLDAKLVKRLPIAWQAMLAGLVSPLAVTDIDIRFAVRKGERRYHWHHASLAACDLAMSPLDVAKELVNANLARVYQA